MSYYCCFKKGKSQIFSLAPRRRTQETTNLHFIDDDILNSERPSIVSSKLGKYY